MTIEWRDAYKIGDREIDAQHRKIFLKANAFLDALDKDVLTEYAMAFFQYTREHFKHEEALMRKLSYPALAGHVQQHNDLIERLNDIAANIANDELTYKKLEAFLTDWLLGHIRTFDTRLAAYMGGKK